MTLLQSKRVCPVEGAGMLDVSIRRWFQNPRKILNPYIKPGMSVLDFGCGPGFFTVEIARLLGGTGKVVAADLQQGMLDKLGAKIKKYGLKDVVQLHKCTENGIGLNEKFDFILVFYMLHEVPDQDRVLRELASLLKPDGRLLVVEPKFHVPKNDFLREEERAVGQGLRVVDHPKLSGSRAMLLAAQELK